MLNMSARDAPPDKQKAQAAKQNGNEAFARKEWAEAVGLYTVAHYADPTEPTYPLNRAMAYIKLEKYLDAERDCTTALKLSPDNVKALYRRATAYMGADNAEAAIKDYEAVLRLDSGNTEAKAGLAKARELVRKMKTLRTEPLDLRQPRRAQNDASTSAAGQHTIESSSSSEADTAANGSSSSVEAARRFLQQVGVSDSAQRSPTNTASASALPAKLPGETGGFLREVTTRKTAAKPTIVQQEPSPSVNPDILLSTSKSAEAEARVGSTARNTASALSFGGPSSQTTAARPNPPSRPTKPAATGKLSAIEFHRKWKNRSERLHLLSALEPASIPSMIDAMLEPELVAEILQTLADAHRSVSSDEGLRSLIIGDLEALPRCKRFGMTVSMLDKNEKGHAEYLIDAVGRSDLKSIWEVA